MHDFDQGLQARSEIHSLLAEHDVTPSKAYGQNFLADPNIVQKIVRVADVGPGSRVVEIGPGTGALTVALAGAAERVVAFEIDRGLETILLDTVGDRDNVDVRFGDATAIRMSKALDGTGWVLVANLPYNVGTGIVLDVLQFDANVTRLVAMVQLEVAERLVAGPGSKTYGIPSVVTALYGEASIAFRVPPQVFEPAPSVESAVVRIDRIQSDPAAGHAVEMATIAFGQRRKMLRKSLSGVLSVDQIEAAGVDPTARPEQLEPTAFLALAAQGSAMR